MSCCLAADGLRMHHPRCGANQHESTGNDRARLHIHDSLLFAAHFCVRGYYVEALKLATLRQPGFCPTQFNGRILERSSSASWVTRRQAVSGGSATVGKSRVNLV
jgi:hypothetical protein